jgi:sortase A
MALGNELREWLRKTARRISPLLHSHRFLPIALIVTGLALMSYVGSQYGEMYREQQRLAERWQQEQQRDIESPQAAADDSMVRLVIPKIDLTSFVVEGTNRHALLLGPGHMENSAKPGEAGNAVISGHRDTFFRHIHELEKGDRIFVERGGKRIVYEVTGKKIVDPEDISVAGPTKDNELTLITCYPTYYIGPAPKRLVVFTKMSAENGKEQDAELKRATATN